jgi:hypothetical protein
MAQDAAGPSTPTEKRSAFRHLYAQRQNRRNIGVNGGLVLSPPTPEWEQKMLEGAALFRYNCYLPGMRNVGFRESAKTA